MNTFSVMIDRSELHNIREGRQKSILTEEINMQVGDKMHIRDKIGSDPVMVLITHMMGIIVGYGDKARMVFITSIKVLDE